MSQPSCRHALPQKALAMMSAVALSQTYFSSTMLFVSVKVPASSL